MQELNNTCCQKGQELPNHPKHTTTRLDPDCFKPPRPYASKRFTDLSFRQLPAQREIIFKLEVNRIKCLHSISHLYYLNTGLNRTHSNNTVQHAHFRYSIVENIFNVSGRIFPDVSNRFQNRFQATLFSHFLSRMSVKITSATPHFTAYL